MASGCGATTSAIAARDQLRRAYELFTATGADAFAERARAELLATGETVRRRDVTTQHDLTPQEMHIARLARDGHSNPEIGAELFISPRTVEWHLRKVFAKLWRHLARRPAGSPAYRAGELMLGPAGATETGVDDSGRSSTHWRCGWPSGCPN